MSAKVQWFRESWWLVTHDRGKRSQTRLGPTERDREKGEKSAAIVNAALAARRHGIALPEAKRQAPTMTFASLAARTLAEGLGGLAATTREDRLRLLGPKGPLVRAFSTTPIDEIRRSDLAKWWHAEIESKPRPTSARRKEGSPPPAPRIGLSEKTGRNYLDALGAAFALAVEREWLDANPVDAFRASRRRRGRTARRRADTDPGRHVRPLPTPEAIDAFVTASRAEGGSLATVDLLLLDGGLRVGEAAALEWSGIEWGADANDPHRALVIRASRSRGGPVGLPKSGRERRVALSRRLRLHLRELWMRAGQPAAGLVVPGLDAANYRHRHFRRVCRAARIGEQWRPKDLRDSYASWLLTCGIQLGYVSRQLGHADVAVTARHYARWAGDDAYRQSLEVGPGEVPADLLARLSRAALASRQTPLATDGTAPATDTEVGRDGAATALDGAGGREGEGAQKHEAPETLRFRAL